MPVPLSVRESIITRLRDNDGRPIEVREWVRENIYKPLDGFKTWPRGPKLCSSCAARVGEIRSKRIMCRVEPHDGCAGLRGFKIVVVVVDVTRQDGKTTGGAGYEITDLVAARNTHCLYLAAAEGQAGRVFDQKFVAMIESDPEAKAALSIGMDSIENIARNNSMIYVPTSARSIASGTYRLLFVDEVRDVEGEVLYKALPMILSVTGVECPHGHYTGARPRCPTCKEELEGFECEAHGLFPAPLCPACGLDMDEFFGRALLCSSAGEESADFTEIVETLKETPDPGWHLFSTAKRLNSRKSKETNDALVRVLSRVPGAAGLVQREFGNVPGRKGDEYLTPKMIEAIADPDLVNVAFYERPCVGFLDCSLTTELTSLVIAGDEPWKTEIPAWTTIATVRIDIFDPTDPQQFPGGRVRYKPSPDGGISLQQHLEGLIPRFPSLVELWIDTTLLEDAKDLFAWTQTQPWRGKIREYPPDRERELVKSFMWDQLLARAELGPRALRIQKLKRLTDELRSAKTKISEAGFRKVMDSGKGDRRGKRRMHRDVSMSVAGCCWIAGRLLARATGGSNANVVDRLNAAMGKNPGFKGLTADLLKRRW